ncbi:MAG: carboxypeptidase-like regulatory domain-containing protein [Planctomycetia bacterium]|nr:carboxypeptidase-like regulatory domain-containing protein [Planctomycetia bacterium]
MKGHRLNMTEADTVESKRFGIGSFTRAMTRCLSKVAVCLLAVALAFVVGCGRAGPKVEFVEGTVLLDGEPVTGADVGFLPVAGGLVAYGRTDSAGKFRLTTSQGGKRLGGAPVGDYAVTVVKWRNRLEELGPQPDPSDGTAAGKWQAEADRLNSLPPDYIVPKAYGEKTASPLNATVKKGRNTGPAFRFDLTSGPPSNAPDK